MTTARHRWLVLAIVCAAAFMGVLDVAIVNVALPSIQRDLGLSQGSLQWIVIAYGLLFGGFLLLGGRLADLLGRRRLFTVGLGVFGASSLSAALAPSLAVLVAARAAQGFGAALTAPAALSILTTTFTEERERNRALGVWGAVAGSGATAGVIAGGLLTSGPGWEWIFLLNVPIAFALALLSLRVIPRDDPPVPRGGPVDAPGALTVTAGLLLLIFGVNRTPDHGWVAPETLVPLAIAALLLVSFPVIERRSSAPLVPSAVTRRRSVRFALGVGALAVGAFSALIFLATLYMQQVLGYSPLRTGLSFLAMSFSSLVASAAAGSRLIGRFGSRRVLAGGLLLLAVGLAVLVRIRPDGGYLDLAPAFVASGLGFGVSVVAVQVTAFAGIERGSAGIVAGLVNTANMIGGALGTALIATLAVTRTAEVAAVDGTGIAVALTAGFRTGFAGAAALALTGAAVVAAFVARGERIQTGPRR